MVKFRGKPKKKQEPHVAGEVGVVQSYSAPEKTRLSRVVGAPFSYFKKASRNTRLAILMLILVLVAGVTFAVVKQQSKNSNDLEPSAPNTVFVTEEEGYQSVVKDLKENPPNKSASNKVKSEYYQQLMVAYANVEKYDDAIESFNSWDAAGGQGLNYLYLIEVAGYYHEVKDDSSAQAALQRALESMPEKDDPQNGFIRETAVAWIKDLQKDYAE